MYARLQANVKDDDRTSSAARQNHRSGFRDVTRAARAVNRECDVLAFLDALGHHREPFDRAAARTALRGTKSQALDDAPRPLAVEIYGVHHDDAAVAPNPSGGKYAAVPKSCNAGFAVMLDEHRVARADDVKTQRGTDQANRSINEPRDARESACGASAIAAGRADRMATYRLQCSQVRLISRRYPLRYSIERKFALVPMCSRPQSALGNTASLRLRNSCADFAGAGRASDLPAAVAWPGNAGGRNRARRRK